MARTQDGCNDGTGPSGPNGRASSQQELLRKKASF